MAALTADLYIHGVPKGQDFWPNAADKNYFGSFYTVNDSDDLKFLIQVSKQNGTPCCYYNYLVYKFHGSKVSNIVDCDGRAGSYFGISLCLNAYCKDIINVYRILDTVFNVYVIGTLLKEENSKLMYISHDFALLSGKLEKLKEKTYELMNNAFTNESFISFDEFSPKAVNNYPRYNLNDCTPESVMADVKKYGKVALSPYYISKREKTKERDYEEQLNTVRQQFDKKMKEEQKEHADKLNAIQESLKSAEGEIKSLKVEISEKDDKIAKLSKEVRGLEDKIVYIGEVKKISQIVENIKVPISDLADAFRIILQKENDGEKPAHPGSDHARQTSGKTSGQKLAAFVKLIMPMVNFLVLLTLLYFACFGKSNYTGMQATQQDSVTVETMQQNDAQNTSDDSGVQTDKDNDKKNAE